MKRPPVSVVGPGAVRGVVLFVSLALLLVLAVATLALAQTATLEVRMARNATDAALAFHAAEAALLDAETWLTANAGDPAALFTATGDGGLYTARAYGDAGPWRQADVWNDGNSRSATVPVPGVSHQPRYIVEWLRSFVDSGTVANPLQPLVVDIFRITAHGTGAGNATALLQGTYGRARGGGTRAMTGRLSWVDLGG